MEGNQLTSPRNCGDITSELIGDFTMSTSYEGVSLPIHRYHRTSQDISCITLATCWQSCVVLPHHR